MENIKRGFKVTDSNMSCRGFKFEMGKIYKHEGSIGLCEEGFHFCLRVNDCFNYYSFDSKNRVFEIEFNDDETIHGDDKSVTREIKFIREIKWQEVLTIANVGKNNTGSNNSGDWNSGDWNSGNMNSGNRNSGNWNSGDMNSGNRNSGDWNSGYRSSGAFCTEDNPILFLFDKPTEILVREWEQSKVYRLMGMISPCIWVPFYKMNEEEKKQNPNAETTDGYLKTISLKEAWANFWDVLEDENKKLFLELPNFDADKFEHITGIKTK